MQNLGDNIRISYGIISTPNIGYMDAAAVADAIVEGVHANKTLDSSCTVLQKFGKVAPFFG